MGAPVGNKNASRAALIRAEIKDAFERRDRAMGKLEGYSVRELFDGFIADAYSDAEIRSELLDRLYGKPAQAVTGGDESDEPIKFERVIRLVKAADES